MHPTVLDIVGDADLIYALKEKKSWCEDNGIYRSKTYT